MEIEPTDDGDRVRIAGRDVTAEIRTPEVAARGLRGLGPPGGARGDGRGPAGADVAAATGSPTAATSAAPCRPDADLKVFLTATPAGARAPPSRRAGRAGVELDEARVLEDVRRRDDLDSSRAASPLRVAPGAVVVDSSGIDADEVADRVMRMIAERAGREARA